MVGVYRKTVVFYIYRYRWCPIRVVSSHMRSLYIRLIVLCVIVANQCLLRKQNSRYHFAHELLCSNEVNHRIRTVARNGRCRDASLAPTTIIAQAAATRHPGWVGFLAIFLFSLSASYIFQLHPEAFWVLPFWPLFGQAAFIRGTFLFHPFFHGLHTSLSLLHLSVWLVSLEMCIYGCLSLLGAMNVRITCFNHLTQVC